MAWGLRRVGRVIIPFVGCAALCGVGYGQSGSGGLPVEPVARTPVATGSPAPATAPSAATAPAVAGAKALTDGPLPEIPMLMRAVEANQRLAEAVEQEYIYRSVATEQELDGRGRVKKTVVTASDHFWIDGVPVRRVVSRDGRELSAAESAKENERIDKDVAKARARRARADAQGKESDPYGNEEITVSRLLELGAFSNPRRVELNGRPTIAVDYTGDPKAKTRNASERLILQMAGTVWVDERDRVLARVEGHFVNSFKVGGGLLVDIRKGTRFSYEQTRVNGEVWLPAEVDGEGSARVLLFVGFSGRIHAVESDYRKFRASAEILPGLAKVPGADSGAGGQPNAGAQPGLDAVRGVGAQPLPGDRDHSR